MKSLSRSLALAGLLVSVSAHAQPTVAAYIEGTNLSGAPHARAYHATRGVQTSMGSQASAHKPKVSVGVRRVRNIPSECTSCPLVATCYPS